MIRVAIDGPGGTGKSTIAKQIASMFDIEYIDTGAMYRAIGLKTMRHGISTDDEAAISDMLASTEIDFDKGCVYLDGEDVGGQIRTGEVSKAASDVSRFTCVRAKVDAVSKHLAATKNVVMEGRDIGTVVIPDAEVKIFMTADPAVRAKRRFDQLVEAGKPADLEQIAEEIKQRDYQDSHRALNPLKQADDAVYLDSSDLDFEQNIKAVADIIRSKTVGSVALAADAPEAPNM